MMLGEPGAGRQPGRRRSPSRLPGTHPPGPVGACQRRAWRPSRSTVSCPSARSPAATGGQQRVLA